MKKNYEKFAHFFIILVILIIALSFQIEIFEDDSYILFFTKIRLFSGCFWGGLCSIG
jgi:hypothetical protein